MDAQREMPKYRCHKTVHALRILSLGVQGDPGTPTVVPADPGYGPIPVTQEWVDRHNPQAGGYYVVYDDGYVSYSPAAAFEGGYTRIGG